MSKENRNKYNSELIAKIALLFTTYSVVSSLLFLYFRFWDAEFLRQIAGILAYPIALFGAVALASQHWCRSIWTLPIALLAFMAMPFLVAVMGSWSLVLIAIAGLGAMLWSCLIYLKPESRKLITEWIGIVLLGALTSTVYFFVINTAGYAHVFSDFSTYVGQQHRDTLFHAAIINMLFKFGIPSTGLDGLVPINYHVGVHRWIAANLSVLGGSTPVLMAISMQIALLPAFFFAMALTVVMLSTAQVSALTVLGCTFLSFWLVASRLWNSYLVSESYAFSLPIFVAMLPVGQTWLLRMQGKHLLKLPYLWEIVIAIAAVLTCWAAKISSGIILAIYLVACILIPKILRNPRLFLVPLLIGSGVGSIALFLFVKIHLLLGGIYSFYPLHFALVYSSQFVWLMTVFSASLYALWRFSSYQDRNIKSQILLVLGITMCASLMPGLLLEIGGGSAGYFIQPVVFIGLLYAASTLTQSWHDIRLNQVRNFVGSILMKLTDKQNIVSCSENPGRSRNMVFLPILCVCLIISLGFFAYTATKFVFIKSYSEQARRFLNSQENFNATELGRVQSLVSTLNMPSRSQDFALYLPPNYESLWNSRGKNGCWDVPLAIPAVTGLPLINGVRNGLGDCEPTPYYGMADYDEASRNRQMSNENICLKATHIGVHQVYIIAEGYDELLNCHEDIH